MSLINKVFELVKLATVIDAVDVLIVAALLYQFFKVVRGTGAERLLKGLLLLLAASWISGEIGLNVINFLLSQLVSAGLLALVVIFQPELRKMLEQFGRSRVTLFRTKASDRKIMEMAIVQIIEAVKALSREKTGALIIFERSDNLLSIINTGTIVNSDINAELIKNIFYPKAPLHDGAVIISNTRVQAAGCILPLTNNLGLSKDLGTRHRAAIGMSEAYDSVSVVVSEETGALSLSVGGLLKRHLAPETLERLLESELLPASEDEKPTGLINWLRGKIK